MRRLLEYQADRIEAVLASHKISARIFSGVVTPRWVRFQLSPSLGTRIGHITNLSEEIALSLGSPSCRVFRRGGFINVEVPRQDPKSVRLLPLCKRLAQVPPCTAVLGLDGEGAPLLLRLTSPEVAHVLISGTTGSGKTELAKTMIVSLALHNRLGELQLVLIDPKGRGLGSLSSLPHLLLPVAGREEALGRLDWLMGEMERRDEEGISEPRIVVFIDELGDLMLTGGKGVEQVMTRLAQRGRGAGIHLVACVQKPTATVVGSLVKSNFPARVVGSVSSGEDARVAAGVAKTGAERLLGRGDFLLVVKGQVIRFQAAYVSEAEIAQVTAQLRAGGRVARGWKGRLAQRLRLVK